MAYHAPEIAHPDSYALQVLAVVLAEGKASRLYQRMVEREQAVTFISADFGEAKDPTLFHFAPRREATIRSMKLNPVFTTNWRVSAAKGVTEHEVDRAKHQIEAHFILSRENARWIRRF